MNTSAVEQRKLRVKPYTRTKPEVTFFLERPNWPTNQNWARVHRDEMTHDTQQPIKVQMATTNQIARICWELETAHGLGHICKMTDYVIHFFP